MKLEWIDTDYLREFSQLINKSDLIKCHDLHFCFCHVFPFFCTSHPGFTSYFHLCLFSLTMWSPSLASAATCYPPVSLSLSVFPLFLLLICDLLLDLSLCVPKSLHGFQVTHFCSKRFTFWAHKRTECTLRSSQRKKMQRTTACARKKTFLWDNGCFTHSTNAVLVMQQMLGHKLVNLWNWGQGKITLVSAS